MAPVSAALHVTLNDDTRLQVIREGYTVTIASVEPGPILSRELVPHIEKLTQKTLTLMEAPRETLSQGGLTEQEIDDLRLLARKVENNPFDRSVLEQVNFERHVVPNLRIYAGGDSKHVPQFRSGEAVSLVLVADDETTTQLIAGTIRALFRS